MRFVRWFSEVGLSDVDLVGGKNASLGEMIRELAPLGIRVPDGFAVTAEAYREFLRAAELERPIASLLAGLQRDDLQDLIERSARIRKLILSSDLPDEIADEAVQAYADLSARYQVAAADVAVRSSATAEDLPGASFAGQQDTYLNIQGEHAVLDGIRRCFASLFTARAMGYRADMGFDHAQVALSVGVQKMVRSDLAASGVIFTLDPESGHREMVLVTSSYGLGEAVVQGQVVPDQFYVHKPTLRQGFSSLVWRTVGSKEQRMVYGSSGDELVTLEPVPEELRPRPSLSDEEVLELARWAVRIEKHYAAKRGTDSPMDIEWGKDGQTGELFVLQARPETVHSNRKKKSLRIYRLTGKGEALAQGLAVGEGVAVGRARVIASPTEFARFEKGEILVTASTDPDWEPIMKMAAGIVTERGGRTSHAAIVARELGIPAVLGTANAMQGIPDGETVTLSCAEGEQGRIYRGALEYEVDELDPSQFPRPRTQMMLNVGSPEQAFQAAMLPNDGVGLARMEFIFAAWVKVHPLALTRFDKLSPETKRDVEKVARGYADKTEYFVDKLSQGIGVIAAAFHPKPVILRLSDFKSNEYATLLGGKQFEPCEENPMIGWRGSSRYYHPEYKEGFLLEAKAIRRAREVFGLTNLKIMVPFCRTPEEGRRVLEVLREGGLVQGENGLEVYVMAELPSNVFLADEYAEIFDGFSIGSNDLTQLCLGVDRDSALVAPLFDERNAAVKQACARIIDAARRARKKVGICGQAPSDFPDFAEFLVEQGIDSISLTPDSLLRTSERVAAAEARPRRLRPARRAADIVGAAANGDLLAEPVAAYADTEPMLPNKKE
ncbi:MAG: phosphoenolpyruvate synthase [Deltaproteobacteria bacterium]|nr:MAG: phosphoenolpyruvate synthase [Deltaproteobacteria bacterium]